MQLTGIHHLTAISAKPRDNVAFYTGLLGLRLVKKTVNQDDVSAYRVVLVMAGYAGAGHRAAPCADPLG
jgi:catechol 2,3-dioxygenase-like lactoylglutathione lyase family enzyme